MSIAFVRSLQIFYVVQLNFADLHSCERHQDADNFTAGFSFLLMVFLGSAAGLQACAGQSTRYCLAQDRCG